MYDISYVYSTSSVGTLTTNVIIYFIPVTLFFYFKIDVFSIALYFK